MEQGGHSADEGHSGDGNPGNAAGTLSMDAPSGAGEPHAEHANQVDYVPCLWPQSCSPGEVPVCSLWLVMSTIGAIKDRWPAAQQTDPP